MVGVRETTIYLLKTNMISFCILHNHMVQCKNSSKRQLCSNDDLKFGFTLHIKSFWLKVFGYFSLCCKKQWFLVQRFSKRNWGFIMHHCYPGKSFSFIVKVKKQKYQDMLHSHIEKGFWAVYCYKYHGHLLLQGPKNAKD